MRRAAAEGERRPAAPGTAGNAGQLESWRRLAHALAACPLPSGGRRRPSAAEQGPMASGTERGAEAAGGPAACYRELSQFPAITRAALGAAAGGQTFLLYTGELRARPPRRFRPTGPARAVADGPLPQSAAAPTCPVAGSCASATTTACGARAAATSPSVGQRSAPRSTTSTAGTGRGVGQRGRCRGVAGAGGVPPTAASLPPARRLLSQDSPTGQRRAVLSRCPRRGHELLEVPRAALSRQPRGSPGRPECRRRAPRPWCAGADPCRPPPPGVGQRRAQPQCGPHGAGEARGGLHGGALRLSGLVPLGDAAALRGREVPAQTTAPLPLGCAGSSQAGGGGRGRGGRAVRVPRGLGRGAERPQRARPLRPGPGGQQRLGAGGRPGARLPRPGQDGVLGGGGAPRGPARGCGTSPTVAQALWSPDDRGVVFVGWWHEPFRLGLSACSNRRWVPSGTRRRARMPAPRRRGSARSQGSGLTHASSPGRGFSTWTWPVGAASCCQPSVAPPAPHGSAPTAGACSTWRGAWGGPHRQCLRLRVLTWQTRQTATVLDVVQEPTEAFTGLYGEALPPRCWAADSRRAVLGTPQRSRTDLLLVDTEAATVTNLTAGSPEGCWELLTLQWDLLVATCSAPHRPPSLVVAVLPPAGRELPLRWVPVEDAPTVPGVTWKTLTVHPLCSGQSPAAHGAQAFEALLLSPTDGTAPHPLVVCPHGGPHAVFDARWRPSMAALCRLGFAVLLVNYRGSLGFGQAGISSLLSHVGERDVADTQLAVEQALSSEPLDPHRLALLAGSHGAFIALHLLSREPERYQACALRSPVSNLPALLGTSDIPDWRYTSLGLPYSFERVPRAEELATMLLRSPIAQAARVRTPVLLCVGARDRRVSPTQALELYRVLRARGVPVRLLWYPEGGHALAGVETEADVFGNCARWLLRHLGRPRRDGTGRHSP
uniref:acylaminoacyl-peptidase n=1 Tax=Aquila chrysaetos chrysaetos TaxID=223781 RepID=A0A663EUV7_AQUCH